MEILAHRIRVVRYGLGATGSAIARLTTAQRGLLNLSWQMAVGARDTHDAIVINATPPVDLAWWE